MTNEDIAQLRAGNIELRNGLIMQWMPAIAKAVRRHSLGTKDDLHNAVEYVAKRFHEYDGTSGVITWVTWCAMGGLKNAVGKKQHVMVGGEQYLDATHSLTPRDIMNRKEYKSVRHSAIEKALSNVGLREQWIVRQYYFKKRTMADIAVDEGVSTANIGQILKRTLARMRRDVEHYAVDLGRA